MARDKILAAITALSKRPSPPIAPLAPDEIADRMHEVASLADMYMDSERWDNQYIAEALATAVSRFADMLRDGSL